MEEKKLHYKMYKDGKKFVFAAIASMSFFVFGGVSTVEVHADTTSGNSTAATVASSASDTKSAAQSAATVASSASDTKSAAQSAATEASSASDTESAAQSAATVASSASDTKSAAQSAATVVGSASDTKSAAQSAATAVSSASDTKSAAQSAATAPRGGRYRRSVVQLPMALSSNSVQPATSISDDTDLKNLGIDINDLNTNSVLKLASLFHIFANQASLSADTNGNLAVKILNGSNDFGTRGDSYNLTSGDIYYIQQLAKNLKSNAFRNKTFNHVVLGKDVNVSIENNKVLINGITMDNLKPENVYQDTNERTYIHFSDVFQQLVKASTSYASTPQSKGVISNYDDMNNRYVDVSKVATGTQIIYVIVPFKYLSASQPITIKGISHQEKNRPTIVINVTDIPNGYQNISTQVQLDYDDGTNSLPNSEGHSEPNHVLWNLGTGEQVFNFSSGRFMGSVLAPNATINVGVNIDGNIVANIVNITRGESHRWDIHPQTPGEPINPDNPDGPKWPEGTDKSSVTQTVIRTVNYLDKQTGKVVAKQVTEQVTYNRTAIVDKATGQIIGYSTTGGNTVDQTDGNKAWTAVDNKSDWDSVTSPDLSSKGYLAPDLAKVAQQTVTPGDKDVTVNVYYNHDVVPVNPTNPQTPGKPINPDNPDGPKWPEGTDKSSVTQTVIRTVNYLDKQTGKVVAKQVTEQVTYNRTAIVDKATGQIIGYSTTGGNTVDQTDGNKAWTAVDNKSDWDSVTSPDLSSKGYLAPDLAKVAQQTVTPGDKDVTVNVYYDHDVVPVNPTNPQTPGEPINPDDPDSPKWPAGTDKNSLTTAVRQTIHYQYVNGSQAVPDKTDSTTFDHQVEIDKVTGKIVKDDGWTAENGKTSFDSKKSPVIPGYTASKPASDSVDGLTHDSKDNVQTIVYAKTPVAGGNVTAKYVDENGNPIADDVIASGNVGDPYSTTQKDVPGYTFKEVQGNPTGSFTDQDQTVTYVYTKNPATDNNGGTGPNQPVKPGNGTDTGNPSSNQPGNPSQPSNATNNGVINTSTNTGSKVNNGAVNSPELPQTGENNSQSQTMSFIGILLAMFGSSLGFLGIKKRRND
ncbi:hypothetical protein BMS87_09010 [Leuconostoc pseudomesenteroides]|nr:hypothetical protein BMS86_09025 [Leuconostoc pseudomesenteroides]ORI53708.1 hypothetical protein BMS87_09010 [Leuconostoc pseudomesenteroides]ORI75301.1 hypothetical protein BMS89_08200 [Leuconostoc pseudomesenteroides]